MTPSIPSPRPQRLKVSEYAEREGVSEKTVRRWIEKGALKITRLGTGKLIRIVVD